MCHWYSLILMCYWWTLMCHLFDDFDICWQPVDIYDPFGVHAHPQCPGGDPLAKLANPLPPGPRICHGLAMACHGLLIAFTALVLQIYASFKIQKSPNSSKLCLSFPGVLFVCWVSCLIGGSPCSGVNRNSAGKSAEKEEVSTLRATRAHWPMAGFKPSGVRLLDDSTSEL